jgi:repressor LexA
MVELSPRQRDVLEFIVHTIDTRSLPPSYREIGDALGISSTNGVSDHVKALIRKGYIRKIQGPPGGVARGLQLTPKAQSMSQHGDHVHVPLVGHVAAGQPMLADENFERTLSFDASLLPGSGVRFALKVRGDSMIDEGIHDGDVVICKQQQSPRNGDIVVATVDGEATVKYFFQEDDRIRLQPANATMSPIFVGPDQETLIQGVVVAVFRTY